MHRTGRLLPLIVQIFWLLILLPLPGITSAQDSCDLKFINHLVNRGDYREALYLIDSSDCRHVTTNDTLNYLKGWSLYSLKELDASTQNLLKTGPASSFYLKSHFFAAYNYTHLGKYNEAIQTLGNIQLHSAQDSAMQYFQLAGISLLQNHPDSFTKWLDKTNRNQYEITEPADNLQKISVEIQHHKTKSPALAAFFSAVVPGSGKLYAGKKGEAVSAFLSTVGLGLVAWENVNRRGFKDVQTILFGTAFVVAYSANIYGAVLSVRILESEYHENVRNTILFNLHIPLRNTYDR